MKCTDHLVPNGFPVPNAARARVVKGLLDARAVNKKHPETFEVPSYARLKKVKPGDSVKISRNNERFWITVTGFEKRRIHGVVDNKLIFNDDLPLGTKIYFQKKHILSYVPKVAKKKAKKK